MAVAPQTTSSEFLERLAHFAGHDLADGIARLAEGLRHLMQLLGPFQRAQRPPAFLGGVRGGDGGVDLLVGGFGDGADARLGRGVDHIEALRAARRAPGPVEEVGVGDVAGRLGDCGHEGGSCWFAVLAGPVAPGTLARQHARCRPL